MKGKIYILLVICILSSFQIMHPFHVGVLEIRADEKGAQISISVRLFMDDLQEAIYIHSGNKSGFGKSAERIQDDLDNYLTSRLHILVEGKEMNLIFEGFEIEEEAVWTYYTIPFNGLPKNLSVKNELLYELYKDQAHFIHYYKNKVRSSHKLLNPDGDVSFP